MLSASLPVYCFSSDAVGVKRDDHSSTAGTCVGKMRCWVVGVCVPALVLDGLALCCAEIIHCLNSNGQQRMELRQAIFSPFHPGIKKISTCIFFFFFARNLEIVAKHNFLR